MFSHHEEDSIGLGRVSSTCSNHHVRDTLKEGRKAFAEGIPLEACPYKPGQAGFQLWDLAWRAARDEASE